MWSGFYVLTLNLCHLGKVRGFSLISGVTNHSYCCLYFRDFHTFGVRDLNKFCHLYCIVCSRKHLKYSSNYTVTFHALRFFSTIYKFLTHVSYLLLHHQIIFIFIDYILDI